MRSFQTETFADRAEFIEKSVHGEQRDVVDGIRTPDAELVV
ncbi:predicted protein [Streptomyces iranensis]|uniref:Uncharacterized protein n=1 Tax=Streptomyces iranensis TaxID=576784 RepID=A0A060ZWG2_9ACTN|nr:hypothetical protein [Streptomyces iranensis]CDR10889.1 predicted protein [Streptomyces iranensis]